MVAQTFVRNERYGCGVPLAGIAGIAGIAGAISFYILCATRAADSRHCDGVGAGLGHLV